MNRKQTFLQAVQILAPGDEFILQAAQLVKEETLPARPGGAALEFVAAMERVRGRLPHRAKAASRKSRRCGGDYHRPCIVVTGGGEEMAGRPVPVRHPITLQSAMRVKSAEYWLKLGQPAEALMELERLPGDARNHPWALKVQVTAIGAARELGQVTVQE